MGGKQSFALLKIIGVSCQTPTLKILPNYCYFFKSVQTNGHCNASASSLIVNRRMTSTLLRFNLLATKEGISDHHAHVYGPRVLQLPAQPTLQRFINSTKTALIPLISQLFLVSTTLFIDFQFRLTEWVIINFNLNLFNFLALISLVIVSITQYHRVFASSTFFHVIVLFGW